LCPPGGGGGGHTLGFRRKTIPDRREFDKLMESGSRVKDNYCLTAPRDIRCTKLAQRWGIRQKWLSLGWGFRLQTFLDVKFPWVSPPLPRAGNIMTGALRPM